MRLLLMFVLATSFALPARAAINPAEYTRNVPDQMRIRETARIVQHYTVGDARLRRVTLVGEVLEQKNASAPRIGQSVVIDYTVDLTARERAAEAHSKAYGTMPGPQFMYAPDPPVLAEDGSFWANVAPAGGGQGNVNGAGGERDDTDGLEYGGNVFVPASGQYSFDRPY
jgi:hypothetical protein